MPVRIGEQRRADLTLAFIAAIWGSTFVLVKAALADCSTLLFLALRFTIGTLVLAAVFRKRLHFTRRDALNGGVLGLFLMAGYILQTFGLRTTTASKSAFLTGLYIILVPLLGALVYRIWPGRWELTGVAIAFTGMAFMTLEKLELEISRGDALTIASAVAYAIHMLLLGRFAASGSTEALSFLQIATGALIAASTLPWAEPMYLRWTPTLIWALVICGVFGTALVFALQTWAQRRTSPTRAALLFSMEPVFGVLAAVVFAGERLTMQASGGALLILAGVLTVELKPAAKSEHPIIKEVV